MNTPLYECLRPQSFEAIAGQDHIVGAHGVLRALIAENKALSILLWGPPGCGKTTIARLYSQSFGIPYFSLSGTDGQTSEIKKAIKQIEENPLLYSRAILFIDELHRINKAGQDIFLPHLEKGTIILVGATTENPSFALNSALLSRLRVFTLEKLSTDALKRIYTTFCERYPQLHFTEEASSQILECAGGDARFLLNTLETLSLSPPGAITQTDVARILARRLPNYDKQGDGHYNLISALHKAIRASDTDASLYWLTRMLSAGEDRRFISRRLIRIASEDIGLADPQALQQSHLAAQTFERLGSPEGELALAQAVIYLSLAPKSNACYIAFQKAEQLAQATQNEPPPPHALNAPTKLMQSLNYGKDYIYDHDTENGCSGMSYFPDAMQNREAIYTPKEIGFEREMKKRLSFFEKMRSHSR